MFAEKLPKLEAALAEEGRTLADIDLVVGPNRHPVNAETAAAYAAQGVQQLVVPVFASSVEKLEARLQSLLSAVG